MEVQATALGARAEPPVGAVRRPEGEGRPGKIEVSAQAIASVAGRAVAQVYGVVGLAARYPRFGTLELLTHPYERRGVDVRFVEDHIAIDVYVVMEYGLRVSEIARNLIKDVKYAVEHALGLPVVEVNVTVQDLRVAGRS